MKITLIASFLLAVVTSLAAWMPNISTSDDMAMRDIGGLFNTSNELVNPESVAFVTISEWNKSTQQPSVFAVEYNDGQWVIPSHFNYPADNDDMVGTTAGVVLNLPRGPLVSNDRDAHVELQVLDPTEPRLNADDEAYGKRYTLKDQSGKVLVDVIVGARDDATGKRYVRSVGDNAVYSADISHHVTTAFRDWVKTDLLTFQANDVNKLIINDYSVDEVRRTMQPRAQNNFARSAAADSWTSSTLPEKKLINEDTIDEVASELASLRLENVQSFEPSALGQYGFFFDNDGNLIGNEGQLTAHSKDGIVYNLYFGEIAFDANENSTEDDTAAKNDRYMVITASYNAELDHVHKELVAEAKAAQAQKSAAEDTATAAAIVVPEVPETPAGQTKAEQEQLRFSKFFYVISDDSFKALRPAIDRLFTDLPEPEPVDAETSPETDDAESAVAEES